MIGGPREPDTTTGTCALAGWPQHRAPHRVTEPHRAAEWPEGEVIDIILGGVQAKRTGGGGGNWMMESGRPYGVELQCCTQNEETHGPSGAPTQTDWLVGWLGSTSPSAQSIQVYVCKRRRRHSCRLLAEEVVARRCRDDRGWVKSPLLSTGSHTERERDRAG